jgi:hypothetical protein
MFRVVVTVNNNGNNIFGVESVKACFKVTSIGSYCNTYIRNCSELPRNVSMRVLQNRFIKFPEPQVYLRCPDSPVMGAVMAHFNPNYILKIIIYLGSILILLLHLRLDLLTGHFLSDI